MVLFVQFFPGTVGREQLVTSAGVTRWALDDPLNKNKSDCSYFYFKLTCSCEGNILSSLMISETGEIHFGRHKSFTFILPPRHQQADVSQLFSQVFLESADAHAVERPSDGAPSPPPYATGTARNIFRFFYFSSIFLSFPPHLRTQWGHGDFNYRVQGAANMA